MLLKQLSSLKYLLRQGLGHTEQEGNLVQLMLLRCEDCPCLEQWLVAKKYLSHEILGELVGLMAKYILRKILSDIREAAVFALIVDEATDVSQKEQLCITVRWVDYHFSIHEDPLELVNVPKTDSAAMFIKDCLVRFCLPIGQCRGQAYDGAANMLGRISGLAARIQQDEPLVHCLAHCTNLCLQAVGKAPVRDALGLVAEVSQLIQFSPKQSSLFQSMQSQLSYNSPSLKPLCPTRLTVRWTVRTAAINSVLTTVKFSVILCVR